MPRQPVSDQKLAANRANAAQSTGPRTPEGKTRSAQNARKHGFTASKFAIVRFEDLNEVANLKSDLVALYRPVNTQELFAVERIALAQQALLRAARLEAGLFTSCLNDVLDPSGQPFLPMSKEMIGDGDIETTRDQNRNYALAEGFHRMAKAANTWSLCLRYQAQSERLYRRAVEEFERLRALRPVLPNEPTEPPELQPAQVTTPAETNPLPATNAGSDIAEASSLLDPPLPGQTLASISGPRLGRNLQIGVGIAPEEGNPRQPILRVEKPAHPLKVFRRENARRRREFRPGDLPPHGARGDRHLRIIPNAFILPQPAAGHEIQPPIVFRKPDRRVNRNAALPESRQADVLLSMNLRWYCHP